MNKDEMIKEMQKDLIMAEQDCVWLYEKEGYRKIADDEQIVNTEQLNETLNSTLESGKRMGYAQGRDETAREILREIFGYCDSCLKFCIFGHQELIDLDGLWAKGAELAQKYGIELED